MEEILTIIEHLLKSEIGNRKNLQKKFYKKFCKFHLSEKEQAAYLIEYVFPNVQILCDKQIIQKDIMYLSLMAYNNFDVLEKYIEYEKSVFELKIDDATSLYDYGIFRNQHWFYETLINYDHIEERFKGNIFHKILALKLIQITNLPEISLEQINDLLENIDTMKLDNFWQKYINELRQIVRIIDYCGHIVHDVRVHEIFQYASEHHILETFSKYIDLSNTEWKEMLDKIYEEEALHQNNSNTQSQQFLAFYILGHVFKLLFNDRNSQLNVNEILEDVKIKILSLKNNLLQVKLLENIFTILFITTSHILDNRMEEKFICKEKEIRLILYFLKMIFDEIKLINTFEKGSSDYIRFQNLNKHVTDAIWRTELIENVKNPVKCETNLLRYMLAQPESLIQMCIKQGDFKRAYQVIEIFGFKNSTLSSEIEYSEKLQILRKELKKNFKMLEIQRVNPNVSPSIEEPNINRTIQVFFKNNAIPFHPKTEEFVKKLCERIDSFSHLKHEHEIFMNMLDLAITQSKNPEHCQTMIHLAFDNNNLDREIHSSYKLFCTKFFELWNEIGFERNLTPSNIIISPSYNLDLHKFKKEEELYLNLAELYEEFNNNFNIDESGILNSNHPSHKSLLKLNFLCNEFAELYHDKKDGIRYISKLYNYLKAFSKILYIEQNSSDIVSLGKNTSYFNLLYHNRSELMGKLLFERNLDPSEFEKYFGKLKLDYLYHVIGNCFPTINLHSQENVTKEELYPENSLYKPTKGIITYIQKNNWLLAFILNEMYKIEDVKIDVREVRVQTFLNYMKLPKIQCLKVLFENNDIVTALQNEISTQKVSHYVNTKILKNDYMASSQYSQGSNDSFEDAQEIEEDAIKTTNWKELYDIIDSIPENQLRKAPLLIELKDMVLVHLVQDRFEINYFQYVQFISESDLRINTILSNMQQWPGEFCVDVIKSEITKFGSVNNAKIVELDTWLEQIELCEELKDMLGTSNWSKAFEICQRRPGEVISTLLFSDKIHLLLKFIKLHKPDENLLMEINENYFITIFETVESYKPIKTLLDIFPFSHCIKVCYTLLKFLKNLDNLQFITDYLLSNVNDDLLKNIQISLKMLSAFTQTEQDQLLCLIYEPLNIIEILIMNTKLDKLSLVLDIVRLALEQIEFSEDQLLSMEKIDEVLRSYAEKSLDFRVITQPNPRLLRTPECKLMQSIDSLSLCSENRRFVMPEEVPLKDEWVPNNEVLECMCCKKITFSMFNRRHHCRRCGRVVCYGCSMHRMLVPTYEDIMVRVCADCYHQTLGDSTTSEYTDTGSAKSTAYDYWFLTDDTEHNKIVREEFSYEHAPSVSLCLSIMKYHSKSVEYPKFLLDQCDVMLKLLQPSQEPIQEIDYLLVIKMLKSLAVAAKMISVECSLHYGTSSADRILSQAELLGLLAERGCLGLLPVSNAQRGSFIDASVLRKLRDRLLEREQWNLALEVSTKAGLDITGVFAVWGKSCLKAGSLALAREKFQRCLDKTAHYESVSDTNSQSDFDTSQDSLSRTRNMSKLSSLSVVLESKPSKNPPLLNEIIYILESKTMPVTDEVMKTIKNQSVMGSTLSLNQSSGAFPQADPAVCIINKLKNLKNIANGNYSQVTDTERPRKHCSRPTIDSMFYNECVYYLIRYGTHVSLLEFYIKHGDIEKALKYIVDSQLSADIFIDIYMRCLKDGLINVLHEHMSRIDSTLNVWKEYLQSLCRHLEKHNMLHSLYQLQQFMGDFIRAAMTCVRFYQDNAKCFGDLLANVAFLQKAEEHLREVLVQDQWVEVASVRTQSESEAGYEEKSLTNPSLVMKMSAKDINKNIEIIWRQKEVVTFLTSCEMSHVKPMDVLNKIVQVEEFSTQLTGKNVKIPTLFGSAQEKKHLAVLVIICGENIDDGFNIALSIIEEFKLKPVKVYCEAGKQLAKAERYSGIGQLVSCIKHSGTSDVTVTDMCDEMLTLAVATFIKANVSGTKVEDLIKLISDRATKISAYIEAKQLKTAYFLAVKYKRMSDIRRILREAELLNQPNIKNLCQKVLQSNSHAPTH